MNWLRKFFRKRQRRIDLIILWPTIRDAAPTLADARTAFLYHTLHDGAWCHDFSVSQLTALVNNL